MCSPFMRDRGSVSDRSRRDGTGTRSKSRSRGTRSRAVTKSCLLPRARSVALVRDEDPVNRMPARALEGAVASRARKRCARNRFRLTLVLNRSRCQYVRKVVDSNTLPYVFANIQQLTGSRRLKSAEDVVRMLGIKADLFENGMSKMDVVAKFGLRTFTDIAEVGDKPVIPYSNLAGALLPATGTQMKFKGHDKSGKLVKNGVYEVTFVHAKQGKDAGKEFVAVDGALFKRKDFVSPQATTGHSAQGDTIDAPFVILEANHFYASKEWFYTAVTRCTRLSDVWVYVGANTTSGVKANIKRKIASYRKQDLDAGRPVDGRYISSAWVMNELKRVNYCCSHCYCRLSLDWQPGDLSQLSINRRCNELPHIESNGETTCLKCNLAYRYCV